MSVAVTPEVLRPPATQSGPIGWVRNNLMSTWYNTARNRGSFHNAGFDGTSSSLPATAMGSYAIFSFLP